MEETMLLWTIAELMYPTRHELCELADDIEYVLPVLEAGSILRH
jgi:hypothetical protein